MEITRAVPHPTLRKVVRLFEERRIDLGSAVLNWPVPPRPHQIIDIHLAQPFAVRIDGGPAKSVPETVLVGPQTFPRARLSLAGRIHVFNILFQPAGLGRLIGMDMSTLVDEDPAASDVLGACAQRLGDAVRLAPDFPARVRAAEQWLATMLDRRAAPDEAISLASDLLIGAGGHIRIDDLVRRSGLSASQFQRRFTKQVGLNPKSYARLVRFDRALVARRNAPTRSWTDILHEMGYFDQAHFIREFHMLAGITPSGFSGDWNNIFFPGND
jgi:AraC-like DNA-binding protein